LDIPILIVVLLFSIIVHECAHGVAALRFGDDTAWRMGRLTLNPIKHIDPLGTIIVPLLMALAPGGMLFGWAKPVPVDSRRFANPRRDQAFVAAAGPASNLVLALICSIALGVVAGIAHSRMSGPGGSPAAFLEFLRLLFWDGVRINVLLALFNLIPLPPLDGSWILFGVLRGEAAIGYARLRPYGFILLLGLLFLGLGGFLGRAVSGVSEIFLSVAYRVALIVS